MNTCKISLSIIFIMSKAIPNISCAASLEMRYNVYHENTETIHTTMNKLFTMLKLKKTFRESSKIRLLLTMHKNLIDIIKNNFKSSEAVGDVDNIAIKESKHVATDEVFEKDYLLLFFSTNELVQYDIVLRNTISEYFKHVLAKINLIKYKNLIHNQNYNPSPHYSTPSRRSRRRNMPRNLKVWIPDEDQNFIHRRIFKSKKTKIKKYPFLTSVHLSGEFACAGSIISKGHVITAASCLQLVYMNMHVTQRQNNISVRIGSDYTNKGGEYVPISQTHFHPQYSPGNLKNNLAILRMSKGRRFSKIKKVRRVLYEKTIDDWSDDVKRVAIVGWGARDEQNIQQDSSKVSHAHLELYDIEECKAIYSKLYVSDSNFCAGFVSRGSGACNKDVGDPAIVAGVLVGVVSFGPPLCGTPDAPTVFTRLGPYAEWIDNILKMDLTSTTRNKPILRVPLPVGTPISPPKQNSGQNRKVVYGIGSNRFGYPEEIFILKELLTNFARSNASVFRDIVEEGFKREFFDNTSPVNLAHHPLVNRSLFGIPGANFPKEKQTTQYQTSKLGPPKGFGFSFPDDLAVTDNKLGEMFDVLYYPLVTSQPMTLELPSPLRTETTKQINPWIGRMDWSTPKSVTSSPFFNDDDSEYSGDANSGNYEESDLDRGMSIEVGKTQMEPQSSTKMFINSDDYENSENNNDMKRTYEATESVEYENIFFVVDNTPEFVKYTQLNTQTATRSHVEYNDGFKNTADGTSVILFNDKSEYREGMDSVDSPSYGAPLLL